MLMLLEKEPKGGKDRRREKRDRNEERERCERVLKIQYNPLENFETEWLLHVSTKCSTYHTHTYNTLYIMVMTLVV